MLSIDIKELNKRIEIMAGKPVPMGATVYRNGINFAVSGDRRKNYSVTIYKRGTKKVIAEVPFTEDMLFGKVYAMYMGNIEADEFDYVFKENGVVIEDAYAKVVNGRNVWGSGDRPTYSVYTNGYDWENVKKPDISMDKTIIYKLHVRGFTMHKSSKVKHKGTFTGIVEKIPYLLDLGINAVMLMPAYEFNEVKNVNNINVIGISHNAGAESGCQGDAFKSMYENNFEEKVNYWGYTKAAYFAPKSSYSGHPGLSVSEEFKEMVKELHKNGIQVFMEFYFVERTNPYLIIDCLRHWVMEYRIDGVSLNLDVAPVNMVKNDPVLSGIKIFGDRWNLINDYPAENTLEKNFAVLNDSFMVTARKFLKSDEGQVYDMTLKIKECRRDAGIVHYIANHNTFTVYDSVSYERKHNEENGENNFDGTDYNYSWNCGIEGTTRKKKVLELRRKQIKNIFSFLLLSQGTPLIYSGDEMCHTTQGNNNPYCQDNDISYINWNDLKKNEEIYEFVKGLINFRKKHEILSMEAEPRMMDYKGIGSPDLSLHGVEPWKPDYNYVSRCFAFMYNEDYVSSGKLYIIFNMYWEAEEFNLPAAGTKKNWRLVFSTAGDEYMGGRTFLMKERSVAVFTEE